MKPVARMECGWEIFSNMSKVELWINDAGYFKILHKKSTFIQSSEMFLTNFMYNSQNKQQLVQFILLHSAVHACT